jgi:lipopolysaccharide transport system ATP-binding protein
MLREKVMQGAAAAYGRLRSLGGAPAPGSQAAAPIIWALRGINLQVDEGEVLGIVGRNGAGKSTLLKILSGITDPTSGYVDLYGRVGSLLEVGAGFHMELTGRENIYMNGAVLGMRHREIDQKFDEIVAFAEVERFLDTPVKRYSSGMYMRLAFAVAAHLEPEVLIVDEVLAVGDAAFQKKCLGKMGTVARQGRTVLFVSHNLPSVQTLCTRAVLIEDGRIAEDGRPADIVSTYLRKAHVASHAPLSARVDRQGDGSVRIADIEVKSLDADERVHSTSRLQITLSYTSAGPIRHGRVVLWINDTTGTSLLAFDSHASGGLPELLPAEGSIRCTTEAINLTPGRCYVDVQLCHGTATADLVEHTTEFDVESSDFYGTGRLPSREWGPSLIRYSWDHAPL